MKFSMRLPKWAGLPEQAATFYARNGWPVLPLHYPWRGCTCSKKLDCPSKGKHPRTKNGLKDATTDVGQVNRWWLEYKVCNVGFAIPDGVVVLDIDEPDGRDRLSKKRKLPPTLTVKTGRGHHLYYQTTRKFRSKNDIFKDDPDMPHVDIKARGGYTVLPPSVHNHDNKTYEWEEQGEMAPAPSWLDVHASGKPRARKKRIASRPGVLAGFPKGERNNGIYAAACNYRRRGLPKDEAQILVRDIAQACQPPLHVDEADGCLNSAYKDAPGVAPLSDDDPQPGDAFKVLADLAEDPKIFDPPRPIVPRTVWAGRVAMIAAREKDGKSTYAGAAAAQVTVGGDFLEGPCSKGVVLWAALEEHIGEVAQRFERFGGSLEKVRFATSLPFKLDEIRVAAARHKPELIVIDTLAMLADTLISDSASSSDWTPLMADICNIARETDAGVLLLHHARKSDGRYRDSTAIGAGVDVILEMMRVERKPNQRRFKIRARFDIPETVFRFKGDRFELVEGQRPLDRRITDFIHNHPKASKSQVAKGVNGRRGAILAEIDALLEKGQLTDGGTGSKSSLTVTRPRKKPSDD